MDSLGVPSQGLVYTGVWTNWSKGRTLGATLTISRDDGNLLVAFIALFVAFAGTSFFRIVCFLAHLKYSSQEYKDGIHHQRQVLLRNSPSGTTAVWNFTGLLWQWRASGQRVFKRILPIVLVICLTMLSFGVAGIFSSNISTSAGNEVLISSPNCGIQKVPANATMVEFQQIYRRYGSQRMNAFRNYAQDCYSAAGNPQKCRSLVRPTLPRTIDRNASCPFGEDICLLKDKNLKFDSGFLDSNDDIGINAPVDKRVQFRAVMHCGPLKTEGFTDTYNFTSKSTNYTYERYFYGRGGTEGFQENYTHISPNISIPRLVAEKLSGPTPSYSLTTLAQMVGATKNRTNFRPIAALNRTDADVHITFLSSGTVLFSNPVDDPWYSAHVLVGDKVGDTGRMSVYLADRPSSPLACASQYQICMRNAFGQRRCSKLSGLWNFDLDLIREGDHMLPWLAYAFYSVYTMYLPIQILGASALTSSYTLQSGLQAPLADNQWQEDVVRWGDIYLSALQAAAVDTATGPSSRDMLRFIRRPNNTEERYFCANQKIRSTEYANFSVLGLTITFSLGGLILLVYGTLEPAVDRWLWKYLRSHRYASIEWKTNNAVQLHRLAHEEIGSGSWFECDTENPITAAGDELAILDISDTKHPILQPKLATVGSQATSNVARTSTDKSVGVSVHASVPSSVEQDANATSMDGSTRGHEIAEQGADATPIDGSTEGHPILPL